MRRARLRRAAVWAAATAAIAAVLAPGQAESTTTYTHGYDISWPQCSDHGDGGAATYLPSSSGANYVILGLTHGAGHTVNPCLRSQLAWAKSHHVLVGAYLVPSYPTTQQLARATKGPYGTCSSKDTLCRAANDGASQAADALKTMRQVGLPAPMVWVDVEFRHYHSWTHSQTANTRVVSGVLRGLTLAGMPYGVYTTAYMWDHIVGHRYVVDAPNWLPGGSGKPSDAEAMCPTTATGGTTWVVQYTRTYDENLTCPAMDAFAGYPGPLWPYRNTTLVPGSSGDAVTALQNALGLSPTTGLFDPQTEQVVLQFQMAHNLQVDGIVDTDDWTALGAFVLTGGHPFLLPEVVAPVS